MIKAMLNDLYRAQLELLQAIDPHIVAFRLKMEAWRGEFEIDIVDTLPEDAASKIKEFLQQSFSNVYPPRLIKKHSGGYTYLYIFRVPPAPKSTEMPPKMPVPTAISIPAMAALQALYDGSEITIKWKYKIPHFEIDKGMLSNSMIDAIMNELSRQNEARFFDGYYWQAMAMTQHVFFSVETIESHEDYVLDRLILNEDGRKFVENYKNAVGTANI